jgi:3-dehydrosphinganine reductase
MYENRVVIITGGSSGLGAELARRFVKEGAHVALMARDARKLEQVRDTLHPRLRADQKLATFPCDVSDAASCEQTIQAIAQQMGAPQLLINSAGILKEGYFDTFPLEDFRRIMDVNYFGALHCIRAVLPYFNRNGGGRIVNIASLGGKFGTFGHSAYCASKFAMVGLTETLRAELKPRNITVQMACPGEFDTPMVQGVESTRTGENRVVAESLPMLPVDFVADQVFAGIRNNIYCIVPGRLARIAEWINRWNPGLVRMLVDAKLKSVFVGPKL